MNYTAPMDIGLISLGHGAYTGGNIRMDGKWECINITLEVLIGDWNDGGNEEINMLQKTIARNVAEIFLNNQRLLISLPFKNVYL